MSPEAFAMLQKEVESLQSAKMDMSVELNKAHQKIRLMTAQQKQAVDAFKVLQRRYEDLKADNSVVLWDYLPEKCSHVFSAIKPSNTNIFETDQRVGDYKLGKQLGEGQFANVHLATASGSNRVVAVKLIKKAQARSLQSLKRVQNEICVLQRVKHKNIVNLVDVIFTAKFVYMFVDLCQQDLFDYFDKHLEGVSPDVAREIITGIASPIAFLHSKGICHRDLKPENILLKRMEAGATPTADDIQICDFGLCRQHISSTDKTLSDFCGSPGFFPPEMVISGSNYNGLKVDVWSIGCILLELTIGHDRFCDEWMNTAYDYKVIKSPSSFEEKINYAVDTLDMNETLEPELSEFVMKCLVVDPDERCSAKHLMKMPWLGGGQPVMPPTPAMVPADSGGHSFSSSSSSSSSSSAPVPIAGAAAAAVAEADADGSDFFFSEAAGSNPNLSALAISQSPPSMAASPPSNASPAALKLGPRMHRTDSDCEIQELAKLKAKIAATSPKPVAATIFSTQSNKQLTTSEALSESLSNRMRLHYGASPTIVTSADSTVSPTHTMFPPISPGTDLPTTPTMASRVNVQAAKTPSAADFERMNDQWQTALKS
ncbi:hypothetical protein TeGR_g3509 [Tetraparma gracilis]|uniref:Protein kinase domain-containing protein n=1 Tax=Tetraparma gracilis TaxID=2962635 RepID=A0ABQ6MHK9_9STRA|nr:hypothetical protein TeGR_g3509 [Tetraparma gracilis]